MDLAAFVAVASEGRAAVAARATVAALDSVAAVAVVPVEAVVVAAVPADNLGSRRSACRPC